MNPAGLSSEIFTELWDQLPHLVWMARKDGSITYINRHGLNYLGVGIEQLSGWNWMQIIHPADREPTMHAWLEATTLGQPLDTKYRMITASGVFRWNLVRARPVRDASGELKLYVGTCTDVEDWKQSIRDLSSANREIEQLLSLLNVYEHKAPIGMGFVDCELRFLRMNEPLADLNGQPVSSNLGRYVREVIPRLWPTLGPIFEKVLTMRQPILNIEITGDLDALCVSSRRWCASFHPVQHAGELLGIALLVVEITEEKLHTCPAHDDEPEVEGHCLRLRTFPQRPSSAA